MGHWQGGTEYYKKFSGVWPNMIGNGSEKSQFWNLWKREASKKGQEAAKPQVESPKSCENFKKNVFEVTKQLRTQHLIFELRFPNVRRSRIVWLNNDMVILPAPWSRTLEHLWLFTETSFHVERTTQSSTRLLVAGPQEHLVCFSPCLTTQISAISCTNLTLAWKSGVVFLLPTSSNTPKVRRRLDTTPGQLVGNWLRWKLLLLDSWLVTVVVKGLCENCRVRWFSLPSLIIRPILEIL